VWAAAHRPAAADTLASATDVRAICDAVAPDAKDRTEALGTAYTLVLPSKSFRLVPYDAGLGRAGVDTVRGFRGEGWELMLHGLIGGRTPPGALDIAFPASTSESRDLAAAHSAGRLTLLLVFQPAKPEASGAVCARTHTADSDGVRLAVEPLAFELRRGDERIASGQTARYEALREEAAPGPVTAPRVVVQTPMRLGAARSRAPEAMARAASQLTPKLLDCYKQVLATEPSLRGSFVVGVEIAADGKVTAARAELDSLRVPAMSSCILAEVRSARFPKGPDKLSIPIRFSSAE
jgi:hypothetical protein